MKAAPDSLQEQAIVWERVATSLQTELNDAYAVAHRWQDHAFALEADNAAKDATIAALAAENNDLRRERDALTREVKALRWTNGARERTITRQLQQIRDLTRRLPRVEQHTVTPAEAYRATHPIESVIGAVVDLQPHKDGYREYLIGCCPFHDGDTVPTMAVRPYYAQFSCYTCGAAGDVLRFLELWHQKEAA